MDSSSNDVSFNTDNADLREIQSPTTTAPLLQQQPTALTAPTQTITNAAQGSNTNATHRFKTNGPPTTATKGVHRTNTDSPYAPTQTAPSAPTPAAPHGSNSDGARGSNIKSAYCSNKDNANGSNTDGSHRSKNDRHSVMRTPIAPSLMERTAPTTNSKVGFNFDSAHSSDQQRRRPRLQQQRR